MTNSCGCVYRCHRWNLEKVRRIDPCEPTAFVFRYGNNSNDGNGDAKKKMSEAKDETPSESVYLMGDYGVSQQRERYENEKNCASFMSSLRLKSDRSFSP